MDNNKEAHGTTFMTATGQSTGGFGQKTVSPAKQFDDFNNTMKDDPFTSGKKEKEPSGKAKTGIASMNTEALTQDVKQRRGSWGFITHQANRLYGTKNQLPQLSLDDFIHNVEFTYGIPLIVLDFVDSLTGSDFIQKLHDHINPPKNVERFDTSAQEFEETKKKIDDDFLPWCFSLFNALGNVDLSQESKNMPA